MGKLLYVRIQDKKGSKTTEYENRINLLDANLVLTLLFDLEGFGLPLRKVIQDYLSKTKAFPF